VEADRERNAVFRGTFVDGQRDGEGVEFIPCLGGTLRGNWSGGALSGSECSYTYPDGQTTLFGTWSNDEMQCASLSRTGALQPALKRQKKSAVGEPQSKPVEFSYDQSTSTVIASSPLLPDPYEQLAVYVAKSTVSDGSGEGLFARRNFQGGELCAYYNGIRLTHREVDRRPWAANSNTISLDETTVLDVPAPFDDTASYCASLGHKANHHQKEQVNAEYAPVFNPRFGNIKCVRSIKPIKAGEEICVDYGYTNQMPAWYRNWLKNAD
jgi:histone-lysine N-methyltransferase SETD7